MRTRLALLFILSVFASMSFAQVTPGGAKSDEITAKWRQIDSLIQILPLALTKKQIDKILPALEKIRGEEKKIRSNEDKFLAEKEEATNKIYKDAIEKGVYPARPFQMEIAKLTKVLSLMRQAYITQSIDDLIKVLKSTLDAGQMKAMVNSLEPNAINPENPKAKDMTEDQKLKYFVRAVWLDSATYDALVKIRQFIKD